MQIKVKDTRMYGVNRLPITDEYIELVTHTVAEAQLVLVDNIKHSDNSEGRQAIVNHSKDWYKPILISLTEDLQKGDCSYSKEFGLDSEGSIKDLKFPFYIDATYQSFKILALPEHFSSKHLQAIVDGKLKDGDKVLIECESKTIQTYPSSGRDFQGNEKYETHTQIKLNSSNHITLHKVEEKMLTQKQAIEFAKYYNGTVMSIAYQDKSSDLYHNTTEQLFSKWFEQNVK